MALHHKIVDVSEKQPYRAIIHKKLQTVNRALLTESSMKTFGAFEEIRFEINDYSEMDTANLSYSDIPVGSVLEFQKAVEFTNAVSGLRSVYLIGTLSTKPNASVLYRWGAFKSICLSEPCDYWEHRKAPWQVEINAKRYFED